LNELPNIDFVLCTHDHFDHAADLVAVCRKSGATFVGQFDLTEREDIKSAGIKTVGMNIGGTWHGDGISVSLTPAIHSCDLGSPTGVVVEIDGQRIYHAGDTALFTDMKLIPELFGPIDVVMLPIGGHFTMDTGAASRAVQLIQPRVVIPVHYNTWPPIETDPTTLDTGEAKRVILQPGETFVREG
jgi:L-ascorbate metabolism protein UlaG (beta-lactamase superfamily)